jgi:hypothetical protein
MSSGQRKVLRERKDKPPAPTRAPAPNSFSERKKLPTTTTPTVTISALSSLSSSRQVSNVANASFNNDNDSVLVDVKIDEVSTKSENKVVGEEKKEKEGNREKNDDELLLEKLQTLRNYLSTEVVSIICSCFLALYALLSISSAISIELLILAISIVGIFSAATSRLSGYRQIFYEVCQCPDFTSFQKCSSRFNETKAICLLMITMAVISLSVTLFQIVFQLRVGAPPITPDYLAGVGEQGVSGINGTVGTMGTIMYTYNFNEMMQIAQYSVDNVCPSGVFATYHVMTKNGQAIFVLLFLNLIAAFLSSTLTYLECEKIQKSYLKTFIQLLQSIGKK